MIMMMMTMMMMMMMFSGEKIEFDYTPHAILRLSGKALIQTRPRMGPGNIVLAAGIRNGQLSYRPDFEQKRLVKSCDQALHTVESDCNIDELD